jgi:uncharacterized protein (DUF4213/DUF364 family)
LSDLLDDLLGTLPDGRVTDVLIGRRWTAVVAEVNGALRCGLASSMGNTDHHKEAPDIPQAGRLEDLSGLELAAQARSANPELASTGLAAINALLSHDPLSWTDLSAETLLAEQGAGKKVVLIGHFPFVDRLRHQVGRLTVLEQNPQPGDLPAESAAEVLPQADVVAVTGTTLINHTLERLLELCPADAIVILLGPTTPLSPVLFDHGIDILCGSVVEAVHPVLRVIAQGGNFSQVHRAGVRKVTMIRPGRIESTPAFLGKFT